MAWIIAAIIGAIIGLLYGSGIDAGRRFYSLINFLIGAAGGVLGVWFFFRVLGLASVSGGVNIALLVLWSVVGAVILMAVIDAINYAVFRSRMRRMAGRIMKEERGFAHEYDIEEETHKVRRRKK